MEKVTPDQVRAPRRRGRRPSRPDPESGPVAAFADRLWRLKREAGDPSYEEMAARLGAAASKSSLAAAAQGRVLPSWETTWEFVRALAVRRLGRDPLETEKEWREHWLHAQAGWAAQEAEPAQASHARVAAQAGSAVAQEAEPAQALHARVAAQAGSAAAQEVGPAPAPPDRVAARADSATAHDEQVNAQTGAATPPGMHAGAAGTRAGVGLEAAAPHGGRERARNRLTVLVAALAAAAAGVTAGFVIFGPRDPQPAAGPVGGHDDSQFEGDITYPDGTIVPPHSSFTKVWRLRNTGTVVWANRFVARANEQPCEAPDLVAIPQTRPGETVDISVPVRTPGGPAHCKIYWKMADEQGRTLFPAKRPIFLDVRVSER